MSKKNVYDCENNNTSKIMSQQDSTYADEMFITISEKSKDEAIEKFCNEVFANALFDDQPAEILDAIKGKLELKNILRRFPCPFTIVQEFYHIDRTYRDSYYTYFSNQHFSTKRFSRRLSFFKGLVDDNMFFSNDTNIIDNLKKCFMGVCVLNPLVSGVIGRTLIHPSYVLSSEDKPAFIRISTYRLHIYGKEFIIDAFPYRMQDGETMRCAEVTLLNIMDYFSNTYEDYKQVVPSDILKIEQKHTHERVLPSQGMTYPMLTKALSEFGFSPRLYDLSSIYSFGSSQVTKEDSLHRILHYYIESGIPVSIGLYPMDNNTGHSIICIGHGIAKCDYKIVAQKKKWVNWAMKNECHPIIDSADFYNDYIVVDDNEPVYHKREFNDLSLHPEMRIKNIAVPLYKRMFLDAADAAAIMRSILQHEQYGVHKWATDYLSPQEDIVMRLFMASSRSLKCFRAETLSSIPAKKAFVLTPMPRFVWVCELYKVTDYDDSKAFGEIIIDATSGSANENNYTGLIMMRYPQVIASRYPEQDEMIFSKMIEIDSENDTFPGYSRNLSFFDGE